MPSRAITIDTNIIMGSGYRFDHAPLNLLKQFRFRQDKFIISDIVYQESYKHLATEKTNKRSSLFNSIKEAVNNGIISSETADLVRSSAQDPDETSLNSINKFLDDCAAERVSVNLAKIDNIISAYFKSQAPFEPTGQKKAEFPDAVALHSLEEWAEEHDVEIIAASNDGGWKKFSEHSKRITVVDSIAEALKKFIATNDDIENLITIGLIEISMNENSVNYKKIQIGIENGISNHSFYGDANSSYRVECDFAYANLDYYRLNIPENYEEIQSNNYVQLAEINEEEAKVYVNATCGITATGEFTYYLYDHVDKEEISIANSTERKTLEIEISIILTVSDYINFSPSEISIIDIDVNINQFDSTVDFGDIDPDYDEQDEAEDTEPPEIDSSDDSESEINIDADLSDDVPW